VAALAAAGCVSQDERVGSVSAALTAPDSAGGTYRLTPDTRLQIYSSTYFDEASLDGDGAIASFDLPVGDYAVSLVHPFGYTDAWPLERTAPDGTIEIVTGYLVTPMPQALAIFEDTTTSLQLVFEVPEFGSITFAQGALDVSLDVGTTTASGVEVQVGSTYTATYVEASQPELASRLPAAADEVELGLGARVTGPFAKTQANAACAPGHLDSLGAVHPGMIDLVQELNANIRICVFASDPPRLMVQGFRVGAATTPTFADLFTGDWSFVGGVIADLPAPVFDGATLDLDPAVGTFVGSASASFSVGVYDGAAQSWYSVGLESTQVYVTVTLTP
jgi:hypothetical protein